jgi:hypothetical protein
MSSNNRESDVFEKGLFFPGEARPTCPIDHSATECMMCAVETKRVEGHWAGRDFPGAVKA